jgi:hypothetical protein
LVNISQLKLRSEKFDDANIMSLGDTWIDVFLALWRNLLPPSLGYLYFQTSDIQVLWTHSLFCLLVLFSVIRGVTIAALLWMLDLWSSCWTALVEMDSSRQISSSAATSAAGVYDF